MAEILTTEQAPLTKALPKNGAPQNGLPENDSAWTRTELNLFRFAFIYFVIQSVPLDWKYYRQLFSIDWTNLYYGDLFNVSRYYPQFFSGSYSLVDWLVVAVIALAGTVIWSYREKSRTEYTELYYWLRVIVRYRLALAVIGYGLIKVFPLQAPFPTLSNLNTNYGDFSTWKMFSVSLGAAPIYEIFLGSVEVLAGLLLLHRKTATIGAFIILSYIGNVFLVNLAYEGGEYTYSLYLVVLAIFLLAFDIKRLVNLVSLGKPTFPNRFKPVFEGWKKNTRLVLKGGFIFVFVFVYGYKTYSGYKHNPHNIPTTPGLANASGLYNVSEFTINGTTLPYSATDPIRWKDVVFETWATLSIRSNRPVELKSSVVEQIAKTDEDKIYELAGTAGRHYYHYEADTVNQILTLHNKNDHYAGEKLVLKYERPDESQFILSGVNETGDSIRVVLDKLDKKYLFPLGRSKPIKL